MANSDQDNSSDKRKTALTNLKQKLKEAAIMGKDHFKEAKQQAIQPRTDGISISVDEVERLTREFEKEQLEEERKKMLVAREQQQFRDEQIQAALEDKKLFAEADKVYEKFNQIHEKFSAYQDQQISDLNELKAAMEKGSPLPEELKKKLHRTPEQIDEAKRDWEATNAAYDIALKTKEHCKKEIATIDKGIKDGKVAPGDKIINERRANLIEESKKADEVSKECEHNIEKRNIAAAKLYESASLQNNLSPQDKKFFEKQAADFKEMYGKSYEQVMEQNKQNALNGNKKEASNINIDNKPKSPSNKIADKIKQNYKNNLKNFEVTTKPQPPPQVAPTTQNKSNSRQR